MKLDKLIEDLLAIQEELKFQEVDTSEVEVLAGTQPTYPLTNVVIGAVHGKTIEDESETSLGDDERAAVWLATDQVSSYSNYNPYAPKALWEVAR